MPYDTAYNRVLKNDKLTALLNSYGEQLRQKEVVDPKKLERFLDFLKKYRHHDECCVESSLKNGKITWSLGVKKWLGQKDPTEGATHGGYMEDFTAPFIQDWYKYYVKAITLAFTKRKLTYLESRFSITVPMMNHKGECLLVKVMSMPFGLTEKGELITLVSSYSIFGTYRGESMVMEIWDADRKIPHTDDSYTEFRRLIAGCIDFGAGSNLTPNCFRYAAIIRTLIEGQKKPNLDSVWKAYKKKHNKDVARSAVAKGIREMRDRLIGLLGADKLTEEDIAPWQPFRPDHEDHFPLIQFCVESGIVDIFKTHKEIKNIRKKTL